MHTLILLLFSTIPGFAEGNQQEEQRQNLGIDYSMPDFSTSKIDGDVIGARLAKMLQLLMNCQNVFTHKRMLSAIQAEQIEELKYVEIDNFKVNKITKHGDEITVLIKTNLKPNSSGIKKSQFLLRFIGGLSKSSVVNDLFLSLGRYIHESDL